MTSREKKIRLAGAAVAFVAMGVLSGTAIHAGISPGDQDSIQAGSGHGVSIISTPPPSTMMFGQSLGESPAPLLITTTTVPGR